MSKILTEDDLQSVREILWPIRDRWESLAIELDINLSDINAIKYDRQGCPDMAGHCLTAILSIWLNQGEATWEILAEALKKPTVNGVLQVQQNVDRMISQCSTQRENFSGTSSKPKKGSPSSERTTVTVCPITAPLSPAFKPTYDAKEDESTSTLICNWNGISRVFRKKPLIPASGKSSSIRLLHCRDEKLVLNEDALKILRTVDKPLAILSICGTYCTGKSYYLSRILGSKDAFAVTNNTGPCTDGIWMSTTILECNDFSLVLLDTEGTDSPLHTDRLRDTDVVKLLALTVLLSSYLVYNTSGSVRKTDLTKMSLITQVSKSVLVRDGKRQGNVEDLSHYFPHFFWIWRDNSFTCKDGYGNPISATEYLKTEILMKEEDADEIASILSLFPSFECRQMPHPGGNPSTSSITDPDFNRDIEESIYFLLSHIRSKKGLESGVGLNGSKLVELLVNYTEALNHSDSVPNLELGWHSVVERRLLERLEREYCEEMHQKLCNKPLEQGDIKSIEDRQPPCTLMGIHHLVFMSKRKVLKEQFEHLIPVPDSTKKDSDSTVMQKFERRIAEIEDGKVLSGALQHFVQENEKLSQEYCEEVFTGVILAFKESGINLRQLKKEYMRKAVGPAAQTVLQRKCRFIPGPPQNVRVTHLHDRDVTISWDKASSNSEAANVYDIEIKLSDSMQEGWRTFTTTATGQEPLSIPSLNPNTEYSIRVRGTNVVNHGEYSDVISFTTKPGRPDKPKKPKIYLDHRLH